MKTNRSRGFFVVYINPQIGGMYIVSPIAIVFKKISCQEPILCHAEYLDIINVVSWFIG